MGIGGDGGVFGDASDDLSDFTTSPSVQHTWVPLCGPGQGTAGPRPHVLLRAWNAALPLWSSVSSVTE